MIGATLGNYRIVRKIGEGGMGVVYLAEHQMLARKAAVKVLLPAFSHDAEVVQRFFNEAQATTAINHPGIVQVFDFGRHEDQSAYIIMEFLEGESLHHRLHRVGWLPVSDALRITRHCASALAAAHASGIIHRDLKPENIFLVPDPQVDGGERAKVLDFGIAKLSDEHKGGSGVKTRTGSVMGTPTYMAPEQCRGAGAVDQRADIYALGCVLYHMVAGRPPFVEEGVGELIASHMLKEPPAVRVFNPSVPPEVEAVVMRTLAKSPDERFSSMVDLAEAIKKLAHLANRAPATLMPNQGSGDGPLPTPMGHVGSQVPHHGHHHGGHHHSQQSHGQPGSQSGGRPGSQAPVRFDSQAHAPSSHSGYSTGPEPSGMGYAPHTLPPAQTGGSGQAQAGSGYAAANPSPYAPTTASPPGVQGMPLGTHGNHGAVPSAPPGKATGSTLGAAAAQSFHELEAEPAHSGRRTWMIAAGVLAGVIGGVFALLWTGGSGTGPASGQTGQIAAAEVGDGMADRAGLGGAGEQAATSPASTDSDPGSRAAGTTAATGVTAAPNSAVDPVAAAQISVTVISDPAGAAVFVVGQSGELPVADSEPVGKTPFVYEVGAGADPIVLRLELAGYEGRELSFPGDQSGVAQVELKAEKQAQAPSAARSGADARARRARKANEQRGKRKRKNDEDDDAFGFR